MSNLHFALAEQIGATRADGPGVRGLIAVIHTDLAPRLVTEYIIWVASLERDETARACASMNMVIGRAKLALNLPFEFEVTAGASNGPFDPCSKDVEAVYALSAALDYATFARQVAGLADPDPESAGGFARERTTVLDLARSARQVLAGQ